MTNKRVTAFGKILEILEEQKVYCESCIIAIKENPEKYPNIAKELDPDSNLNTMIKALNDSQGLIFNEMVKNLEESGVKPVIIPTKDIKFS